MAQNTLNSPTVAPFTTADIVVAAGASVTVGIYAAAGTTVPTSEGLDVWQDTPAGDNHIKRLNGAEETTVISGPGTFRMTKGATATALGAFSET